MPRSARVRLVPFADNELVYDSFEWNRNLPNTIEAFFVTRTDVVHDVQVLAPLP